MTDAAQVAASRSDSLTRGDSYSVADGFIIGTPQDLTEFTLDSWLSDRSDSDAAL